MSLWFSDRAAAEATYGHISHWSTRDVTDMSELFCAASWESSSCNAAALDFYEDIGAWDTSGVTTLERMFYGASAFDQDLGWCVGDDVSLSGAFSGTPCASTSCGVKQVDGACAATPAPTTPPVATSVVDAATPARGSRGLVALVLALFLSS